MSQKSFTPENTYFANVYTSNALFVYHFDGKCKGNIVSRDVFFFSPLSRCKEKASPSDNNVRQDERRI